MEEGKRMYSLNLAAYILCVTALVPAICWDDVSRTCYFQFVECAGVINAIKQFRTGNPSVRINDFLRSIKIIRTGMEQVKQQHGGD